MDENKNPESRYDVDEEEGATTVLRAMDAETEDEEEGATTVLRAEDMPPEDDDDTEGATTVLTRTSDDGCSTSTGRTTV